MLGEGSSREIVPSPNGNDILSTNVEYFRISKAANILGCTPDDLLHLGVNCKVEIMAPVLAEGIYLWAIRGEASGYPEIVDDVKKYFDASQRVILSQFDLAKIEAIGWATPTRFYAPTQSHEIDKILRMCAPDDLDGYEPNDMISIATNERGRLTLSLKYSPVSFLKLTNTTQVSRRVRSYFMPWCSERETEQISEKTTIDHLFISKKEVIRLVAGIQLDNESIERLRNPGEPSLRPVHGNTENNANNRVQVLKAAIYCARKWPDLCKGSNAQWADTIVLPKNVDLFWPKKRKSPLKKEMIARLLGEALRYGDQKID